MLYCKDCKTATSESPCPRCGNAKLREIEETDLVFLAVKDVLFAGMLEDVLTDNGIPYKAKGMLGAGLSVKLGTVLERYVFYVPYSAHAKAEALLEELFPPEGEEVTIAEASEEAGVEE